MAKGKNKPSYTKNYREMSFEEWEQLWHRNEPVIHTEYIDNVHSINCDRVRNEAGQYTCQLLDIPFEGFLDIRNHTIKEFDYIDAIFTKDVKTTTTEYMNEAFIIGFKKPQRCKYEKEVSDDPNEIGTIKCGDLD